MFGTGGLTLKSRYYKDLQLASRFLFLSMTIVVIEQDIRFIEQGPFKIKTPYLDLLMKMNSIALNERKELQKIMKSKNIQVIKHNQNKTFSSFLFLCQGREEIRNYFNPAIRKKVEKIIQELIRKSVDHVEVNS